MSNHFMLFVRRSIMPFRRSDVVVAGPYRISPARAFGEASESIHRLPGSGWFNRITHYLSWLLPPVRCCIADSDTLQERYRVRSVYFDVADTTSTIIDDALNKQLHHTVLTLIDPVETFSKWYYHTLTTNQYQTFANIPVGKLKQGVVTQNNIHDQYTVIVSPIDFLLQLRKQYELDINDSDLATLLLQGAIENLLGDTLATSPIKDLLTFK